MAKRGPSKTPSKVLRNRGSWRAETRKGEPEPEGEVVRPTWLSDAAAAKWDELAPMLLATGVLTVADVDTLAEYCHFWTRREAATAFIKKNGDTHLVHDGRGKVKGVRQYPQVWMELKYAEKCERLRAKLGMDPAARSNLSVEKRGDGAGATEGKGRFFG